MIGAAIAELGEAETVLSLAYISVVFQPRPEYPTPFRPGRYGSGSYPVFYAALDESTSTKERGFYYVEEARIDRLDRYYTVFTCKYVGDTIELMGQEEKHPHLVSLDQSGYPFCQHLGSSLRQRSDGLLAPSARNRPDGVCVPIFSEGSLSEPRFLRWVVFSMEGEGYRRSLLQPRLVT